MGYVSVFQNQKTSLKKECQNNNCLASEFDNIWYSKDKIKTRDKYIIKFYENFESIEKAKEISDHIPIVVKIDFL